MQRKRVKKVAVTNHPWDPGVGRDAQTISGPLQWGWIPAVLSDPVHVASGVSAHAETLHHRRPVLTRELREDLPPGHTISNEMPRNGKRITMNLNVLLSQLTNVKSQLKGEWRQENSEFLTHKPTLLLVALMHAPKCLQIVSRVHPQMPPPPPGTTQALRWRNTPFQRKNVFSWPLKYLEEIRP